MRSDVVIRQAELGDAERIADVYLRAFDRAMPTVHRAHTDDEVREWVRGVLVPGDNVVVAELDARLVGMMVLSPGWIEQLYVDPDWQRSGVGSQLVDRAKSQGSSGLHLWTFQVNRPAQRFYERHGFVVTDQTDGSTNEEQEPALRYSWVAVPR